MWHCPGCGHHHGTNDGWVRGGAAACNDHDRHPLRMHHAPQTGTNRMKAGQPTLTHLGQRITVNSGAFVVKGPLASIEHRADLITESPMFETRPGQRWVGAQSGLSSRKRTAV